MKLAIITPTRNRLYTLSLLHKYIARQTRKPDLWIIATDGEKPNLPDKPVETIISLADYAGTPVKSFTGNLMRGINVAEENGADAVLIMEDDDWYASEYVEQMEELFSTADVIGNKPTKSINIVNGAMKEAQHGYFVLAQLGFTRSKNDLFRASVEQCIKDNTCGVDKKVSISAKENGARCGALQTPKIYLGMKGIYDIGSGQAQGLTEQHRRYKKYFKGYIRQLLFLNKSKKDQQEQNVYGKLCQAIGEDDAAAYWNIISGAKQNQWGNLAEKR